MNTLPASLLTLLSLFAFAANSVLCRLALSSEQVDPLTFTTLRLLSAALTLTLIIAIKNKKHLISINQFGSYTGATYLFIYAAGFSYAYVTLGTATGALILFACVQFTMLLKGWLTGVEMSKQETLGISLSLLGFGYFVYPELNQPSLIGCILMSLAGIAWGLYSLNGAKSSQALLDTTSNFLRLLPVVLIGMVWIYFATGFQISLLGWLYTIASGALASGIGYGVWYFVLPHLKPSIAAVSQLSVPIWAALGGLALAAEPIDPHLALSASVILSGILLVILAKQNPK
ncbi:DMT family transporter [uncultured Paraglaciecola sp.]|uniref:DMT family transporter n=1 Tax=uncultured Paraglaciecola sp. TaxID=1765024 RepID=UPI002624C922|nr:DMT family transporter [uncultured Paraglaciecola sp.]